jgi:hypothetical protein
MQQTNVIKNDFFQSNFNTSELRIWLLSFQNFLEKGGGRGKHQPPLEVCLAIYKCTPANFFIDTPLNRCFVLASLYIII